jgi:hypothetical protein
MKKTISILRTELDARPREVQELHVLLQQAQKQAPAHKTEDTAAQNSDNIENNKSTLSAIRLFSQQH